jgi:hypothetical protein
MSRHLTSFGHGLAKGPGDPGYVTVEEATKHILALRAEWAAWPSTIEAEARKARVMTEIANGPIGPPNHMHFARASGRR